MTDYSLEQWFKNWMIQVYILRIKRKINNNFLFCQVKQNKEKWMNETNKQKNMTLETGVTYMVLNPPHMCECVCVCERSESPKEVLLEGHGARST